MFPRILFALPLLTACTVGPVDESAVPAALPILLAADDTPIGTYLEGTVSLDAELVRSLRAPETGEGGQIDIALRVGENELAVDPDNPLVPLAEPLEPGAQLAVVIATDGVIAAEIPVVVGDSADAEEVAYSMCVPVRWTFGHVRSDYCGGVCPSWSRYHEYYVVTCDSCGNCWYSIDSGICGLC